MSQVAITPGDRIVLAAGIRLATMNSYLELSRVERNIRDVTTLQLREVASDERATTGQLLAASPDEQFTTSD